MRQPSVIRVFFAIELSDELKTQVGDYIHTLKKQLKSHAIRWTKPANLHITLQFLAEVNLQHIPLLLENVKKEITHIKKKLLITIEDLHFFPNPFRPRVIVLTLSSQQELAEVSAHIGLGIKTTHYPIEERSFHGHLTLGRLKHPHFDLAAVSSVNKPLFAAIQVDHVVLFQSEPDASGAQYTVLERLPFALNDDHQDIFLQKS